MRGHGRCAAGGVVGRAPYVLLPPALAGPAPPRAKGVCLQGYDGARAGGYNSGMAAQVCPACGSAALARAVPAHLAPRSPGAPYPSFPRQRAACQRQNCSVQAAGRREGALRPAHQAWVAVPLCVVPVAQFVWQELRHAGTGAELSGARAVSHVADGTPAACAPSLRRLSNRQMWRQPRAPPVPGMLGRQPAARSAPLLAAGCFRQRLTYPQRRHSPMCPLPGYYHRQP